MNGLLSIVSLLLVHTAAAQVYCAGAIGHTPQHERIFFPKGSAMAADGVIADLGPAPVFPEAAAIGTLFANVSGERADHLYQSCLPEVPLLQLRLQCAGNLLSESDVFALLSGSFAVPRSVWMNHEQHVGGRYIFSLIGSGNKRYLIDLRGGSTAVVFFPDGTYRCIMPNTSCADFPVSRVMDMTTNQPSVCELHCVSMTQKVVEVSYGMDRSRHTRQKREARWSLFPHAEEAYDSGFCIAPRENQARVWVCGRCTEARRHWLSVR